MYIGKRALFAACVFGNSVKDCCCSLNLSKGCRLGRDVWCGSYHIPSDSLCGLFLSTQVAWFGCGFFDRAIKRSSNLARPGIELWALGALGFLAAVLRCHLGAGAEAE